MTGAKQQQQDSTGILEELQFLLEEDNRVVTYKFVSNNFDIHINKAKCHLQSVLDVCRGKGDNSVTATYFLAGPCRQKHQDFASFKAFVVSEDQLTAARDSLTSVTSEHVYSVQRHRVCESAVLYGADLLEQRSDVAAYNRHGAITCKNAELIPEAEMVERNRRPVTSQGSSAPVASRQPSAKPAPVKAESAKEEVAQEDSAESKVKTGQQAVSKATAPSDEPSKDGNKKHDDDAEKGRNKKPASKRDGTIASMFANASAPKKVKTPPKKAPSMMSNFLKKGSENPEPQPNAEKKPTSKPTPAAPDSSDEEVKLERPAAAAVRFGAKKTVRAGRQKKRSSRTGGERQEKKRRRILAVASDSSDTSEDEGRDAEPEEPEPEPADAPQSDPEDTPATQSQSQNQLSQSQSASRRRRKLVSKTFQDEEGFMVTKKVQESCSESDSEVTVEVKKDAEASCGNNIAAEETPKTNQEPPKTSLTKKKQPGIMSFFKKK